MSCANSSSQELLVHGRGHVTRTDRMLYTDRCATLTYHTETQPCPPYLAQGETACPLVFYLSHSCLRLHICLWVTNCLSVFSLTAYLGELTTHSRHS